MCTRTVRAVALGAVLSLSLLTACSGGPSAPSVQQLNQPQGRVVQAQGQAPLMSLVMPSLQRQLRVFQAAALAPAHPGQHLGAWMYTANLYGNDLSIYQRNGNGLSIFENITSDISQPSGTKTTTNGWWYVTNAGHSNVLVYKTTNSGPSGPLNSLDDSGQLPVDVDAVPSRKLVAVSNFATTSYGPASVSVYVNRSAIPSRNLTFGKVQGQGIAIDHQGNCYWGVNGSAGSQVVEFSGCAGAGTPVLTGLSVVTSIVFDQKGNLYYLDPNVGIYKCQGTSNCSLFSTGFGDPTNMNFDHHQKSLWVADATGYIDQVSPKTGKIEQEIPAVGGSTDPPIGIAPAPGG